LGDIFQKSPFESCEAGSGYGDAYLESADRIPETPGRIIVEPLRDSKKPPIWHNQHYMEPRGGSINARLRESS